MAALLAVYLVTLAVIGLSPTSPIDGLDLSQELDATGFGWVTYTQLESFANVMLFVPFGILIALLVPTRWWWLVIVGLIGAAIGIELGQAVFLPDRVASLGDVVANSSGGIIGVMVAAVIRGIGRAIRRPRSAELRA